MLLTHLAELGTKHHQDTPADERSEIQASFSAAETTLPRPAAYTRAAPRLADPARSCRPGYCATDG